VDSEVYQAIKALYISQGLALPSTTGPWSEAELILMLDRIDSVKLRNSEITVYNFALEKLNESKKYFKFGLEASLEMRTHANTEDFTTEDDYIRPWSYTKPLLNLDFDFFMSDIAYGYLGLPISAQIYNATVPGSDGKPNHLFVSSTGYGTHPFSINVFGVPPNNGIGTFAFGDVPYRAFVTAGGDSWNVVVGRDRLSWGPGESGNFIVGDHIQYHNSFRTAWFNDKIKWTFNISSFQYPGNYYEQYRIPHPDPELRAQGKYYYGSKDDVYIQQYWSEAEYVGWHIEDSTKDDALGGWNLFIAHRLEWRIFNKVNMALTEAVMEQVPNGQVPDLTAFIPSMILHNIYRKSLTNSIVSIEADWSVIPRLNIYAQVVVDEFTMPGEKSASEDSPGSPAAFGYMLGAKTALPVHKGMLSGFFEAVYTDPYLYLRSKGQGSPIGGIYKAQGAGERGVNFIVANRYREASGAFVYPENFLGYRWGGDAVVLNAGATYRSFGNWEAGAKIFFMAHGTHDKWTTWSAVYATDSEDEPKDYAAPTTTHDTPNSADDNASSRNAIAYTTAFSLLGNWNFWKGFSVYGEADFIYVANFRNIKGRSAGDVQLTLGVTYSL